MFKRRVYKNLSARIVRYLENESRSNGMSFFKAVTLVDETMASLAGLPLSREFKEQREIKDEREARIIQIIKSHKDAMTIKDAFNVLEEVKTELEQAELFPAD